MTPLLTIQQAAKQLHVSVRTLEREHAEGKITFIRVRSIWLRDCFITTAGAMRGAVDNDLVDAEEHGFDCHDLVEVPVDFKAPEQQPRVKPALFGIDAIDNNTAAFVAAIDGTA